MSVVWTSMAKIQPQFGALTGHVQSLGDGRCRLAHVLAMPFARRPGTCHPDSAHRPLADATHCAIYE